MGKPFDYELKSLKNTIIWAKGINSDRLQEFLQNLDSPIYVVGSGGSLSACHFAVSLLNNNGKFARAVTPLELFYLDKTIHNSSILFLSASGNNYDIRFAFKRVLEFEPKRIGILTMRKNNYLTAKAKLVGIAESFDFEISTGKDGFLATNSLIAFFVLLNNSLGEKIDKVQYVSKDVRDKIIAFLNLIKKNCTITILHGGWSKAVAYDIESKCSEAGLTPTLVSDFRNFGHGRHHWFSKRSNSAIIALTNIEDEPLCAKTLDTLPNEIPKLILRSEYSNSISSVEHLVKSFEFIRFLGEKVGIDPGRPGVPEYGRKLYHLPYSKLLVSPRSSRLTKRASFSIKRKLRVDDLSNIDNSLLKVWKTSYDKFRKHLDAARFGMVLFDYDGTLCSAADRFQGISDHIVPKLLNILEKGYIIGIVTGRGKSVRVDLSKRIPTKYFNKVMIGYYNGSDCGLLSEDSKPRKDIPTNPFLKPVVSALNETKELYGIKISERPNQVTIKITNKTRWNFIRNVVIQILKTERIKGIQILESSHSMDIIPESISKTDVLPFALELLKSNGLSTNILSIGDKGQWAGNDFILLDNIYGLSVDEVSSKLDTCWNLSSMGNRNISATLEYLNCLYFEDTGIHFKMNK